MALVALAALVAWSSDGRQPFRVPPQAKGLSRRWEAAEVAGLAEVTATGAQERSLRA